MVGAEAAAAMIIPRLLQKLMDKDILAYFGRGLGVRKKVPERWIRTLTAIEAVLGDAEERQLTQRPVKEWLEDLIDLAFDVQNLLDRLETRVLKRKIERQQGRTTTLLIGSLIKPKFNFLQNSKIKKISSRLQELTTREKQFGLKKLGVSKKPWKTPPTISQLDGPVIGRLEAIAQIENFLSNTSNCDKYSVFAIVGAGGLGKTTLAKHIFKAANVDQFSRKAWVSVSDDFDIVRVAAAVLASVTSASVDKSQELDSIMEKLSKELANETFLIVLDDVWDTCDYGQWRSLQSSFHVGAAGSRIIITTRDANVAKRMGDNNPYYLEPMSNDDCWEIFKHHALLHEGPQDVELFKEKVVTKSSGLPLVAMTLGGLLLSKGVEEWEEILDHDVWKLSEYMGILPALKLSYHYLPSALKRCFSFCAIFPYGYEFEEMPLILWWMAEGLIEQQPGENRPMEDLGRDYFQHLVSRSLFQRLSKGKSLYIMHDLITDLARWAAGSSCSLLEDMQNHVSHLPKVRHSSFNDRATTKELEFYSEAIRLRTFLRLPDPGYSCLAPKVVSDVLPKLQCLRLLSVHICPIYELPDTIGKLKHLRFLDLSYTLLRCLPDSVATLYNLQTLILKECHLLKALPTSMRNLVNLRHLNISGTSSLEEMPPQLGELTNLQTLTNFFVGKGSGSGIGEIGSLLHLQGTLHLSRLENVICVEEASSANIKSKERLEALLLEWSAEGEQRSRGIRKRYGVIDMSSSRVKRKDAALVLSLLQPPSKLKELTIKGYTGLEFSSWIGDPSFSNMVRVRLEGCIHCQFLPPFGQLPSLKELLIRKMDEVESVGFEFYGEGDFPFQKLETLEFEDMKKWKTWSPPCQQNEGVGVLSCLKTLSIINCPKLEGKLPEKLDSLERLSVSGCGELVLSVSNYKQLHASSISNCKMLVYDTSSAQFDLLKRLTFSDISMLRSRTEAFTESLKNVEFLSIKGCEELTHSFPNEDRLLQHLVSLRKLDISSNTALVEKLGEEAEQLLQLQILDCKIEHLMLDNCRRLLKIPEGLHHFTSLQFLTISRCSSLVSFPDIGLPPCILIVKIEYCDSLLHFAKNQIPPSLRELSIRCCLKMKSLIEKEEEVGDGSSSCLLERLCIYCCPSLMYLCRGILPRALEVLVVVDCRQLELITQKSLDDTCKIKIISIRSCPNLGSLPEGLCHLTNLQSLDIMKCQSLSLPRMTLWPGEMSIISCKKLEVTRLVRDMVHDTYLRSLGIDYCDGLTTIKFFNLTTLNLEKIKNCKALMECQWLRKLSSLRHLSLMGEDDPSLVSFPPGENSKEEKMLLPVSLNSLKIGGFPNLTKLREGFQFLTSLNYLGISFCPKLKTLPAGLPLSLVTLSIFGSPLLEKRYKDRYQANIAHIANVGFLG